VNGTEKAAHYPVTLVNHNGDDDDDDVMDWSYISYKTPKKLFTNYLYYYDYYYYY